MTKKEIEKICKKVINYPFLVVCEKRSKKYTIQIYSAFDESLYKKIQETFNIRNFSGLDYLILYPIKKIMKNILVEDLMYL